MLEILASSKSVYFVHSEFVAYTVLQIINRRTLEVEAMPVMATKKVELSELRPL
jgi:hypothetical protein